MAANFGPGGPILAATKFSVTGPSSTAPSLFPKLRCPQSADILRKREAAVNSSPLGQRRSAGRGNFDP